MRLWRVGQRWPRLLYLLVLLMASVLCILIFGSGPHLFAKNRGHLETGDTQAASSSAFLVDSPFCRIPAQAPWDPLVAKFARAGREKLDCVAGRPRPLVASEDDGRLRLLLDALPDYNLMDASQLRCCYTPLKRQQMEKRPLCVDDVFKFAKYCTPITAGDGVRVEGHEFVRVQCFVKRQRVFQDLLAFFFPKEDVEERCLNASKYSSEPPEGTPSVLLLGIDSMSRLNLHRHMPLTIALLNKLGAIEMLGFNTVGYSTFHNLVGMLSGLTEEELWPACWPEKKAAAFDECPLVWRQFARAGFRTAFGEDGISLSTLHKWKRRYVRQPTDYYLLPLYRMAEKHIAHTTLFNYKACWGTQLTYEMVLEHARRFAFSMRNLRSFGLFWTSSLTHDSIPYSRFGDRSLRHWLLTLHDARVLESSVVILMSDHGMRYGDIRFTYQGGLEQRLPFLFFLFPPSFRERYPMAVAAVEHNARRLISPFDVHATLVDLLQPHSALNEEALRRRSLSTRGISLFLQVPQNRTCEDAGISAEWCTCQESFPIPVDCDIARRSADVLLRHVNALASRYEQCVQLSLVEIFEARQHVSPRELRSTADKEQVVRDYLVVVRTRPGDALLEATIRYRPKENSLVVVGSLSRNNMYGNQSACVSDGEAKLYCFCRS